MRRKLINQGVALTGRKTRNTVQCRPPMRRQRYKRRQTTMTDDDTSEQNNTDPLGGPVTDLID